MTGKRKRKISNASRTEYACPRPGGRPGRDSHGLSRLPPLDSSSLLSPAPSPAGASRPRGQPPVDTQRFPRLVRLFLLPDEEALLKELQGRRRTASSSSRSSGPVATPRPGTPANEFEDNVRAVVDARRRALLVRRTRRARRPGAGRSSRCSAARRRSWARATSARPTAGHVAGGGGMHRTAPGGAVRQHGLLREGSTREPETWVYRDRPGLPLHVHGRRAAHRLRRRVPLRGGRRHPRRGPAPRRGGVRHAARHRLRRGRRRAPRAARGRRRERGRRAPSISWPRRGPTSPSPSSRSSSCAGRRARRSWRASSASAAGAGGRRPPRLSLAVQAADATGQAVASAARESLVAAGGRRLARRRPGASR